MDGSKLIKIDKNILRCLPALHLRHPYPVYEFVYQILLFVVNAFKNRVWLFNTTFLFSLLIGIQCIGPKPHDTLLCRDILALKPYKHKKTRPPWQCRAHFAHNHKEAQRLEKDGGPGNETPKEQKVTRRLRLPAHHQKC